MVEIKQNILSKIDLYYGSISMPKGFEINREILQTHIVEQIVKNSDLPF